MSDTRKQFHEGFMDLMEKSVENLRTSPDSEYDVIKLGEMLRHCDLQASEREEIVRRLDGMVGKISFHSGKNARAYLVLLALEIKGPVVASAPYHPRFKRNIRL